MEYDVIARSGLDFVAPYDEALASSHVPADAGAPCDFFITDLMPIFSRVTLNQLMHEKKNPFIHWPIDHFFLL